MKNFPKFVPGMDPAALSEAHQRWMKEHYSGPKWDDEVHTRRGRETTNEVLEYDPVAGRVIL